MRFKLIPTTDAAPILPRAADLYKLRFPSRDFATWAKCSTHALLLLDDNGHLAGVCQLGDEWVGWLAIDPVYQNLGYGRMLARAALRLAGHCPNVVVNVREGEADESKFWRSVRKGLW